MPTFSEYSYFILANAVFFGLMALSIYFKSANEIKENWPQYRCNPAYWGFSDDVRADFTYCIQNTQVGIMGYMLQPLNYLISSLSNVGGGLADNVNSIRAVLANVRSFITDIIQNVFSVFLNIVIEFQRMMISIKDMIGKTIGVVVTILYIMDGSIKTMNSAWAGPSGQLVRALGSCFHPDTPLYLSDGTVCRMEDVPVGAVLEDGKSRVFSVMKIAKTPIVRGHFSKTTAPLYKIPSKTIDIYVTGSHYIFSQADNKYIPVSIYQEARVSSPDEIPVTDYYCCLITNTGQIPIDGHVFLDWEDDGAGY